MEILLGNEEVNFETGVIGEIIDDMHKTINTVVDIFSNVEKWDKGSYIFNREIKDMYPYEKKHFDDRDVIAFNVLGMSKEDISLKTIKENQINYLHITGIRKNKLTGKKEDLSTKFYIDIDKIKNIKYKVEDGLLYITLYFKQPEKVDIKIDYDK